MISFFRSFQETREYLRMLHMRIDMPIIAFRFVMRLSFHEVSFPEK